MTRPNILFLLPDQLRPDFLGCYGADFLRTPAIDALAEHGTRYETAISPAPICVPARASMLTGQHSTATGVMDNLFWLRPDHGAMGVRTWAETLTAEGYATAAIGKMHFYPWDTAEGFETRIIAEDKRHIHIRDDYDDALRAAGLHKVHGRDQAGYVANRGASLSDLPDALQVDRWVANRAADWIAAAGPGPWAAMVGFPGPHCPYDPPAAALERIDPTALPRPLPRDPLWDPLHAKFLATYRRGWADMDYDGLTEAEAIRIRHHYAALVERLDADVATIMAALAASGALENTVVVFASDHGDYLGDYGMVGKTWFHEPAIRVPLIVTDFSAPAAPATVAAPVSLLDLPPTFLSLADAKPGHVMHGVPLGDTVSDRVICGVTTGGMMARDARWKLVRYDGGPEVLHDLSADPFETSNLIDDAPEVRARLEGALTRALLEGLISGHADKRVPAAQSDPASGFFGRGWTRPYPQG